MKDRAPRQMSEKEIRFASMTMLGQLYVRLGQTLNETTPPDVRAVTNQNRWQIFNRMTDQDRASLYSYETYLQDEISRKNGQILIHNARNK